MLPGFRWLKNLSIGGKLNLGLGVLVILTLFVTGLSYLSSTRATTTIAQTNEVLAPAALEMSSAQANLLRMLSNIHGYLLAGNPEFREAYSEARKNFESDLQRIREMSGQDKENQRRLDEIQVTYTVWSSLPNAMFDLSENPLMNEPALRIFKQDAEPLITTMLGETTTLFEEQLARGPQQTEITFLRDLANFQKSLDSLVMTLQAYVATSDQDFKQAYEENLRINDKAWQGIWNKKDTISPEQLPHLEAISSNRPRFLEIAPRIISALEGERSREDLYIFRSRAVPLAETMLQLLDEATNEKRTLLTTELSRGNSHLNQTRWQILFWGMCAIVVGVLLSLILRRSIIGPIYQLTSAAEHIAEGNLDERVPTSTTDHSKDEIRTLARAFNTMAHSLQQSQHQLEEYNRTLEAKVEQRTRELNIAIREARKARDVSEAANRAKSQFLANMSHELRTPLNGIIGYSEMLQEEASDYGYTEIIPDLVKINTAGKHLLSLINDILDISKIEAGKMDLYLETIDLASLIHDVVTTIHPLIEKNNNTLHVKHDDPIGAIVADQTKVRQILFNLLSNATKFTRQGDITLELWREKEPATTLNGKKITALEQNKPAQQWIVFRVTDSGIGLSHEHIEHLFKAFSQADSSTTRKYGGTGLGLAINQHFCEMMGGSIGVHSVVGQGAVFTVRLPAEVDAERWEQIKKEREKAAQGIASEPEPPIAPPPLPSRIFTSGTVLVIDDDPVVRDLVSRRLSREGLRVETATSGIEGIQRAREILPDVITLDVMMPEMDGWSVLSQIKSDPDISEIPVIMLTILEEQEIGFTLGATDYLIKPVEPSRLASLIRKYGKRIERTDQGEEEGAEEKPVHGYVLVVEDDAMTREMLMRTLQREGWTTVAAENGRAALDCVAQNIPDLILLDLMMPEIDGFQVIRMLRSHEIWRTIPVIVVTAMELTLEERQFLDGYVSRVLQKASYSREDLLQEVCNLVSFSVL